MLCSSRVATILDPAGVILPTQTSKRTFATRPTLFWIGRNQSVQFLKARAKQLSRPSVGIRLPRRIAILVDFGKKRCWRDLGLTASGAAYLPIFGLFRV